MKKVILLCSVLTLALGMNARHISQDEAREIAAAKIGHLDASTRVRPLGKPAGAAEAPLYLFNAPQGGFAVVAGDTDMSSLILAYSTSGSIDPDNCHPALRGWLEAQAAMVTAIQAGTLSAHSGVENVDFSDPVAALITTTWNQGSPYNAQTPIINDKQSPTGCVATALAQILNFWKYPADCYVWSLLLDAYDEKATEAENAEVARLMAECGAAVDMQYGEEQSGAGDAGIWKAIREVYGFDKGVRHFLADYMPRELWTQLVVDELRAGRPVLYGGNADTAGHQFICDGFDADGLFHINWGWGGDSDGYFELDVLAPEQQGTGGAGDGMAFKSHQDAYFGLQPPVSGTVDRGWMLGYDGAYASRLSDDGRNMDVELGQLSNVGLESFKGITYIYFTCGDDEEEAAELIEFIDFTSEEFKCGTSLTGIAIQDLDATEFEDGIYELHLLAEDTDGFMEEIYSRIGTSPLTFEVSGGKFKPLALEITNMKFTPIGVCYYDGFDPLQYYEVSFDARNLSVFDFKNFLRFTHTYSTEITEENTFWVAGTEAIDLPAGQSAPYTILIPLCCGSENHLQLGEALSDEGQKFGPLFVGETTATVADIVYSEFEFESAPVVTVSSGKPSISAEIISTLAGADFDPSNFSAEDYPHTADITCRWYDTDGNEVATAVTDTYDGWLDAARTLTFASAEALEEGNYYATLSYTDSSDMEPTLRTIPGKIAFAVTGQAGVGAIDASGAEAVYTDLLGRRIAGSPAAPGLYLRRTAGNVEKILVK